MMERTTDEMKRAVLHQLEHGEANALKGKVLAARLEEKDTRQFRLVLEELREDGVPVIGGSTGYFIAESPEEIRQAMERLTSYIRMLAIHRRCLKHATPRVDPYQVSMKLPA